MFIKNLLAVALLAFVAAPAFATENDVSATASVNSKFVDRGVVAGEDVSLGFGVRVDDVLTDGLFIRGSADTFNLTPVDDSIDFRSEVGAGYGGVFANTAWEASAARVFNDPLYSDDYTEVRGRLTRGIAFAEVAQGLTGGVNKDTYLAVGVERAMTSLPAVTVGALASAVRYDGDALFSGTEFNNAQVFARYNMWRNLDAQVNYSVGGRDRLGRDMDNQFWGGLTYRF